MRYSTCWGLYFAVDWDVLSPSSSPVHVGADLRRRAGDDRGVPLPPQAADRLHPEGQQRRLPGQPGRPLVSGRGDRASAQTGRNTASRLQTDGGTVEACRRGNGRSPSADGGRKQVCGERAEPGRHGHTALSPDGGQRLSLAQTSEALVKTQWICLVLVCSCRLWTHNTRQIQSDSAFNPWGCAVVQNHVKPS